MPCLKAAFASLFLICNLAAQHVLPAGRDTVDAPSLGQFAGASAHLRQQVLIDESHLQPLVGKDLTELWFRRDFTYPGFLLGAVTDLSVQLSVTAMDPNAPSEEFESNLGFTSQMVFDGTIVVPNSSSLSSKAANWEQENTVRIRFVSAFTYPGGTLVVDLTGEPFPGFESSFWPVDVEYLASNGHIQDYGESCGRYASSSSVSAIGLEIGATASFGAWGAPNALAFLVLGEQLASPIELSPMGATGCFVYIGPMLSVPTSYSEEVMGSGVGGASVDIQIPTEVHLLGGTLDAQWATLEMSLPRDQWSNPSGWTTSNATQFTLGTAPPSLGISMVTSHVPLDGEPIAPTGNVEINKGPVLRFFYQ